MMIRAGAWIFVRFWPAVKEGMVWWSVLTMWKVIGSMWGLVKRESETVSFLLSSLHYAMSVL